MNVGELPSWWMRLRCAGSFAPLVTKDARPGRIPRAALRVMLLRKVHYSYTSDLVSHPNDQFTRPAAAAGVCPASTASGLVITLVACESPPPFLLHANLHLNDVVRGIDTLPVQIQ